MAIKKTSGTYVTNKTLNEAVDAILSGMDRMLHNLVTKDEFKKLDKKVDELKVEVGFMHDDIRNLQADTPTLSQFNKLKQKVYGN